MKANEVAKNPTYIKADITLVDARFLNLCREIKFGEIKVKVAHGQPVDIDETIKNHRLDLTNTDDFRTLNVNKPHSALNGSQ